MSTETRKLGSSMCDNGSDDVDDDDDDCCQYTENTEVVYRKMYRHLIIKIN